jgi:hypothetical protein
VFCLKVAYLNVQTHDCCSRWVERRGVLRDVALASPRGARQKPRVGKGTQEDAYGAQRNESRKEEYWCESEHSSASWWY